MQEEGFHYEETLTGFKWLGNRALELQQQGYHVLFAFEEAIGFMLGTAVRDKVRAWPLQLQDTNMVCIQVRFSCWDILSGIFPWPTSVSILASECAPVGMRPICSIAEASMAA